MTFFQSALFEKFQEKIPYRGKTWRISGNCLVVRIKMRFGFSWLWLPYAPPLKQPAFVELAKIAKKERAIFARVEPNFDDRTYRYKTPRQRFTPEHSLILDLEKSEEEILAQMKPKGRYNISTALRHGVSVEQFMPGRNQQCFDDFYQLLKNTAGRDKFGIHPKFFYKTLLEAFGAEGANLFLAYSPEKKVIGGIIVIFYKDTATYYYGASDYEYRNLMAPYLLQWEAIREAKRRGMKHYDFLGIAPPHAKSHPYAGITEFKKKFGGREITHPPAFDVVYRPILYRAMRLVQFYRR